MQFWLALNNIRDDVSSKQANKKTDFTVELLWWGLLRPAPTKSYTNCGIIAVVMGIILSIIGNFLSIAQKHNR